MALKNARFRLKRGSTSNWEKASQGETPFKPLEGEPIFYKDKNMLKIGDGNKTPEELAFLKAEADLPLERGEGSYSI